MSKHTIILIQPGKPDTRTYSDFESVQDAMEGICHIFESHLRSSRPHQKSITYDITELNTFIDQLADISCLVFQPSNSTYYPHPRDWIKQQVLEVLKKQAAENSSDSE